MLLLFFAAAGLSAQAQAGADTGSVPAPATAPAPVPTPAPVTAPVPPSPPAVRPAEPTNATTAAAPPVYNTRTHSIDVNRLRFGAYIAPNISWMRPTASTDDANQFNTESNGSRLGFTYGLMAEYFFAENYGLVTGLSVNSTGGKMLATTRAALPVQNSVKKADFEYRLQYLDIPLALKLRTDDIGGFRFFGQLGASIGFNISKKADYTVEYYDTSSAVKTATGSKIKLTNKGSTIGNIAPIMFQMNIGAGAEYPLNAKLRAYVALFFNNGFAPDATNPEKFDNDKLGYKGSFKDANTRLNNFALRLGLFF